LNFSIEFFVQTSHDTHITRMMYSIFQYFTTWC